MSSAQAEPSMEEILASIRRIISEDEEDAPAAAAPAPRQAAAPAPAPVTAPRQRAAQPAQVRMQAAPPAPAQPSRIASEDDQKMTAPSRGAEAAATPARPSESAVPESIVSPTAGVAAAKAFQTLTQKVRVTDTDSRTLEDIVVEMMKPMVKSWLDAHLPAIVEEKVEAEVRRLARQNL